MTGQVPYRITDSARRVMLGTALTLDLIGIFPIFGDAVNWAGWLIFYPWFGAKKIKFLGTMMKEPGSTLVNFLFELFVEAFLFFWPGLTFAVWKTIKKSREEDEEKFKKAGQAHADNIGGTLARQRAWESRHKKATEDRSPKALNPRRTSWKDAKRDPHDENVYTDEA